jgi:hypothetical protein
MTLQTTAVYNKVFREKANRSVVGEGKTEAGLFQTLSYHYMGFMQGRDFHAVRNKEPNMYYRWREQVDGVEEFARQHWIGPYIAVFVMLLLYCLAEEWIRRVPMVQVSQSLVNGFEGLCLELNLSENLSMRCRAVDNGYVIKLLAAMLFALCEHFVAYISYGASLRRLIFQILFQLCSWETSLALHIVLLGYDRQFASIFGGWVVSKRTQRRRGEIVPAVCFRELPVELPPSRQCPTMPFEIKPTLYDMRNPCKPQFGAEMAWGIEGVSPMINSTCMHNQLQGLHGRVGGVSPLFKECTATKCSEAHGLKDYYAWRDGTRGFMRAFNRMPRCYARIDRYSWLEHMPKQKQNFYRRIIANREFLNYDSSLFRKVKSHVKREKANPKYVAGEKTYSDPRIIQAMDPVHNVVFGPYVYELYERLKKFTQREPCKMHIMQGRQCCYSSGLSTHTVGQYTASAVAMFVDPVIVEIDVSRFDACLDSGAWGFMKQFYKRHMALKDEMIEAFVPDETGAKGRTDTFKYKVRYTMLSGRSDTNLADSIISMGAAHAVFGTGKPWWGIFNGDDSVIIVERSHYNEVANIKGVAKLYIELGLAAKVQLRNDLWSTEYCSSSFRMVGGSWNMVPKLGRLLPKMFWCDKDLNDTDFEEWKRSVLSSLNTYGQADLICRELAHALGSDRSTSTTVPSEAWRMTASYPNPVDKREANELLLMRYGMGEGSLESLIAWARSGRFGKRSERSHLIDRLLMVDAEIELPAA